MDTVGTDRTQPHGGIYYAGDNMHHFYMFSGKREFISCMFSFVPLCGGNPRPWSALYSGSSGEKREIDASGHGLIGLPRCYQECAAVV